MLEALRILLKSEGYQTEGVTSLAGISHALEKKEYALLLMDLNYTRDTTSGRERRAKARSRMKPRSAQKRSSGTTLSTRPGNKNSPRLLE